MIVLLMVKIVYIKDTVLNNEQMYFIVVDSDDNIFDHYNSCLFVEREFYYKCYEIDSINGLFIFTF